MAISSKKVFNLLLSPAEFYVECDGYKCSESQGEIVPPRRLARFEHGHSGVQRVEMYGDVSARTIGVDSHSFIAARVAKRIAVVLVIFPIDFILVTEQVNCFLLFLGNRFDGLRLGHLAFDLVPV